MYWQLGYICEFSSWEDNFQVVAEKDYKLTESLVVRIILFLILRCFGSDKETAAVWTV